MPNLPLLAADKPLPPGESLLPPDFMNRVREADTPKARVTLIDVSGQPFQRAARVVNKQRMSRFYDLQVSLKTIADVKKGDVLHVRFYARGSAPKNETGEAEAQVYFQQTSRPWRKLISQRVSVGDRWMRFDYPFVVDRPYPAGAVGLFFGFGFNEQAIEIGGVQLLRMRPGIRLRDLPRTPVRYPGSAPDARWRAAAAERIEEHRQRDWVLRVTSADGKPVPGARVQLKMTRHAFQFSSIVNVRFLNRGGPEVDEYKRKVLELFNASGNENALKWPTWENEKRRLGDHRESVAVLRWLKDNGLYVRGHVLVWPSWRHLPRRLLSLHQDSDAIRTAVRRHIADVGATVADLVDEVDVINETRTNHDLMDLCGREVMVDWFRCARQAFPGKELFINDFGILNSGSPDSPNAKTYRKTIQFLLDHGAPVTGIGLQGHMGSNLPDPGKVVEILDSFAKFGLKIRITEFDVNITDEETQANFTRDFMTAVFSHPAVVGLQMWGFWEGQHWKPNAALYRRNWEEKPNAKAYKDLVFGDWWTDIAATTDDSGIVRQRCYLGDYEITVSRGDATKTVRATLTRDAKPLTVALP